MSTKETIESQNESCTECGKPSEGVRCCGVDHAVCDECCTVLDDGYQYCARHAQDARDEIAEREVYRALANLRNVCLCQKEQAYRCRELIGNLALLARRYMEQLKPLEEQDDAGGSDL